MRRTLMWLIVCSDRLSRFSQKVNDSINADKKLQNNTQEFATGVKK